MKTSMTIFGCGPKLALLCLPYIILSLIIMFKYPEFLDLKFLDLPFVKVLGFVWLVSGVFFWIYSAIFFLKRFIPGKLLTQRPFCYLPESNIFFHNNFHYSFPGTHFPLRSYIYHFSCFVYRICNFHSWGSNCP